LIIFIAIFGVVFFILARTIMLGQLKEKTSDVFIEIFILNIIFLNFIQLISLYIFRELTKNIIEKILVLSL